MPKNFFVLCLLFIISSSYSFAGEGSGRITEVAVQECCGSNGPYVIFKTEERINAPSCTDNHKWFAFALNTEVGKHAYSLVLLAFDKGTPVKVLGTGNCQLVRNVFEDVDIFRTGLIQP